MTKFPLGVKLLLIETVPSFIPMQGELDFMMKDI